MLCTEACRKSHFLDFACTCVVNMGSFFTTDPFNMVGEAEGGEVGFSRWERATERLLADNPDWTGMGKLTHDVRLATDLLLQQPDVDPARVLAIGHSLGGKMAFCTCSGRRFAATFL